MGATPQEQVMGFWLASVQFRCIAAAAQLGLPDALAEGPQSVEALAAQTKTDAANLFRLMRAIETIGVFKQVSPRVFENTAMSECLRKGAQGWA